MDNNGDTENKDAPPVQPATPAKAYPNLKPIQPGEVRNPAGKKPGTLNRKTIATRYLEMAMREKYQKLYEAQYGDVLPAESIGEQIIAQLVVRALSGDMGAADRVLDAAMDKVTDKVEHSGSFAALLARAQTPPGELPKFKQGDDECKETLPPTKPAS